MPIPCRYAGALLAALAACQPATPAERLPTVPLLAAVPAGYRPVAQTDTLRSYWAPPAAHANNPADITRTYLSEVQLQVQLVPASAAHTPDLDTLTFHRVRSSYGLGGGKLSWFFDWRPRRLTSALLDGRGEPVKVFTACTYALVVTEEAVDTAGYRYARNRYTMDYPFCPVAVAYVSDTVAYARAYLLQANQPRLDTLYAASRTGPTQRLPHEADRLDTTRQALLRFSLRQLRHSATPAGY